MASESRVHETFLRNHPHEAAAVLETLVPAEAAGLLTDADVPTAASVLARMEPNHAADVLGALAPAGAAGPLRALPVHVAANLLQRLGAERARALLDALPRPAAAEIVAFQAYPPDSAGSLMDTRVMALPADMTTAAAIEEVRRRSDPQVHDVCVIDRDHRLVGTVALRELLRAGPAARLEGIMRRDALAVHALEDRQQVVDLCNEHYVPTLPVVDLDQHLLGVIRTRELFRAGQAEAATDMVTMVGASRDERALSPVLFSVRKRLPWLQVNLLTAFLAAFVVGLFEDTIARFTALAVLLPVVAGQSGNTGSQSLAVVMRGLALRDVRPAQWLRVSVKEVAVGVINGVLVAVTTGAAVYVWSGSPGLVLVIVTSMVLSMCIAGFAGAVIPNVLRALEQDPAQSSSIILTTVTDVVAFLSFLGLATLLAPLLV